MAPAWERRRELPQHRARDGKPRLRRASRGVKMKDIYSMDSFQPLSYAKCDIQKVGQLCFEHIGFRG